jgi:hypothetical protein
MEATENTANTAPQVEQESKKPCAEAIAISMSGREFVFRCNVCGVTEHGILEIIEHLKLNHGIDSEQLLDESTPSIEKILREAVDNLLKIGELSPATARWMKLMLTDQVRSGHEYTKRELQRVKECDARCRA